METLIPESQKSLFWNNNCQKSVGIMSSVIVCPNCRSTLAPCVSVTCPLIAAPSAVQCQGCHSGANACLASGLVPHFPLPYVCRHWLQVSHSTCSHGHTCNDSSNVLPTFRPCTQQAFKSQQPLRDSPKVGLFSTSSHGVTKDLQSRFSVTSRGGSPESVLPDYLIPLTSFSIGVEPKVWTKEDDERVLSTTKEELEECGWYYGALSWQEAAALLANTAEGTFLVRDSSSSHCPYALSVQTPQGPTSIRIEYEQGKFWLACERKGVTPQLDGVIELVEFYKALAASKDFLQESPENMFTTLGQSGRHVWVDHRGKVFSPIKVVQPLRKGPPSLQHLCRLATRQLSSSQIATLPPPLTAFLQKYRHDL